MNGARTLRIVCPRECGKVLAIQEPGGSPFGGKPPHQDPLSRWVRRRVVRVRGWIHDYKYGAHIKEALLYHYLFQCSQGLAANEDCGADCPYCTESEYRCDREMGHEGDHEEHDEQDRLLHNWRNETVVEASR